MENYFPPPLLSFVFAATLTLPAELAFTTTAVFDPTVIFVLAFASTTVAVLFIVDVFASLVAAADGAVSSSAVAGASDVVCKTETFPVNAGIAKSSAESIKTVAAPIVILDKTVCAPRG